MSTTHREAWFQRMSVAQRQALFNLVIILTSVLVVLSLMPVLGFRRAHGALGILGFVGLGPFLFGRKAGEVFYDERDAVIQARSWAIAYSIFWLTFVAACITAPLTVGSSGFVPVEYVQLSVWYGFIIVWGISAGASLVQYAWGATHDAE
jgi:hypothetical protein